MRQPRESPCRRSFAFSLPNLGQPSRQQSEHRENKQGKPHSHEYESTSEKSFSKLDVLNQAIRHPELRVHGSLPEQRLPIHGRIKLLDNARKKRPQAQPCSCYGANACDGQQPRLTTPACREASQNGAGSNYDPGHGLRRAKSSTLRLAAMGELGEQQSELRFDFLPRRRDHSSTLGSWEEIESSQRRSSPSGAVAVTYSNKCSSLSEWARIVATRTESTSKWRRVRSRLPVRPARLASHKLR